MATKRLYHFAVYIGRFQPIHNGHLAAIKHAASVAEHVLVLVGSSNCATSPRNPFTYAQRVGMIQEAVKSLDEDDFGRNQQLLIRPLNDFPVDIEWQAEVQRIIDSVNIDLPSSSLSKVVLVGHMKDESSYYLKLFPQLYYLDVGFIINSSLSATDIRETMFALSKLRDPALAHTYTSSQWAFFYRRLEEAIPRRVLNVCLMKYIEPPGSYVTHANWDRVCEENDLLYKYRASWISAPYAPTFVTVDAVVVCAGHVLLVRRSSAPGKGLMALPGGFLEQNERLLDGAIRELREETKIKVPTPVLRGSLKDTKVFDRPDRSLRGRTITHAFYFVLSDTILPKVKAASDAAKVQWVPLSIAITPQQAVEFFEDHWHIVRHVLNLNTNTHTNSSLQQ